MEQEIILEARNITKVYPGGVVANHNVNLQIKKGEIHALVGENGAGKSTLMKMLFGMLAPTEGQIFVDGKEVHFSSSSDAIAAGLGMVLNKQQLSAPGGKMPEKESVLKQLEQFQQKKSHHKTTSTPPNREESL